jgi:PAS domain S-box-containing protein
MSPQSSPSSPFPTHAPNLGPGVDPKPTPDVPLSDAIIRASEDAIFSTTLQGIVTSWNPAAVRLFGYTAEQMIGSFTTLPFFPDRLKEKEVLLDNLQKGRAIERFESTQLHKDGTAFRVTLTVFPIRNAADEVDGIATIVGRIFPPPEPCGATDAL